MYVTEANYCCFSFEKDVPNESISNNNTKDPQVSVQLKGEKNPIQCQIGEHLIAFWVEGNETKWYLGFRK